MSRVRPAGPDDLDAIVALDWRCFTGGWSRQGWQAELERGGLWVSGDPVVGFACASFVLDRCELRRIAVSPRMQGRGLGRDLLSAVMEQGRERGCTVVELEVAAGNRAARRLYEACGFRQVGCRRGYYRDPPEDALLLDRPLETR